MARRNSIGGLYLFFHVCVFCASGVILKRARFAAQSVRDAANITVFVSDFFDGFPGPAPSLSRMNLTMASIYGAPVCTGSSAFIPRAADAPPSFCRYSNSKKETAIRPDLDFDQFALERVMLAKWQQSPRRCFDAHDPTCGSIVVVPSPALHRNEQLGYNWNSAIPPKDEWLDLADKYWDAVQSRFHQPETNYTPIVVMHTSYVWTRFNLILLLALAQRPFSFMSSVALLGIESNIPSKYQSAFPAQGGPFMMALPYPTSLLDNVPFTQDEGTYVASRPRDVVLSMFACEAHKGEHHDNWIRDYLEHTVLVHDKVMKVESLVQASGAEEGRLMGSSWYANPKKGLTIELVCRDGAPLGPNCGLGLDFNMWTLTANSAFCLEPNGDTPTRSHFYVAALSGCIPVIFDGGQWSYGEDTPTRWAWRRNQSTMAQRLVSKDGEEFHDGVLNYSAFAVVFNASDVKTGKVDVIKELTEMPMKFPDRFQLLRHNLAQAARFMRYAKEPCTARDWTSTESTDCRDAFTIAQQLVVQLAQSNMN